ncbi:MAG: SusD/RagB family nutrient-binding outer membrane lipoprotein [Chitinophagaceae bacterium]|nr:SusD/RagB family nutrient-binding outer membrane lipoprotein [Chitinophagaceae bacterium]
MKKLRIFLLASVALGLSTTSCDKFLDINTNPNSPTSATPDLILPQAIVRVAALEPSFNNYGNALVGYWANAGGFSGWGSFVSYNYTTADYSGLFSSSYKAIEDLDQVVIMSEGDASKAIYAAAAKVLQVYSFQNLVDVYNDIPYTEALKGVKGLQPKYDKAEDVYKALADTLDVAMSTLSANSTSTQFKAADKLFKGDLTKWLQFANTIKLRLILRSDGKVSFSNTSFNSAGFLKDDALVNPGYEDNSGKQSPMWGSWAYTPSGANAGSTAYIPTHYIMAMYDGTKITDPARVAMMYSKGTSVPRNQLGYQGADAQKGVVPCAWYVYTGSSPSKAGAAKIGILKGPGQGQPLMLAAESYFLQAQANLQGIVGTSADAKANFENGIKASYNYLAKTPEGTITPGYNATTFLATYISDNATSKLVNFDACTTDEERLEAIVTQQYIAYNMILGHQAWFEYQRTGYPRNVMPNTLANNKVCFSSFVSEATAADKLPTRVLYPESEFRYNSGNVPTGVDKYTSKIFWAK